MQEYTIHAAIEITATGVGASPQDVLDRVLESKDYEITDARLDSRIVDNYVTLKEYREMHNMPGSTYFSTQCKEGKIPGIRCFARTYLIPKDLPLPTDRRVVSGKWAGRYEKYGKKQWEKKKSARQSAARLEESK